MYACLLAGCGAPRPVAVVDPSPQGAARTQCSDLVAALPDRVAGQAQREVGPSDAAAAAWGDPPIVLRCGVGRPPALRRTSECRAVDHVGWFATQNGEAVTLSEPVHGPLVLTTIGRSVYVEVTVPAEYQPQADALVDVAAAVSSTTADLRPCH